MDVLLDVNIVLDVCVPRPAYLAAARDAIALCRYHGDRVWVYTGSVQTLEYNLLNELKRVFVRQGIQVSTRQVAMRARALLQDFCSDKQWLAALAGEGDVFASDDPEDEQLLRALARLGPDARLLSRDGSLAERYPDQVLSPEGYLAMDRPSRALEFIDLKTPQDAIRADLERGIHRVLHHGQYILGPEIAELEAALAEYVGVKHGITVASGTDSLEIALRALGIGPGDEVITVPFTWISSAEVIGLVGARPVLVDIEPASFNIDVAKIEAAITPRTKAILPVSLFGQMPDYGTINAIAARHGLPVIEDAAQSFGATQHGRRSGGVTTIGSTSFFPAKPLGCYGDGGALFTDDDGLAEKMRAIRTHGGIRRHHHPLLGMNGRFDSLQAAVLLAKLPHLAAWSAARRANAAFYDAAFADVPEVVTPYIDPANESIYNQYTLRVEKRDELQAFLKAREIGSAIYYPLPLHLQECFAYLGYKAGQCPEAEKAATSVLSLPVFPELTAAQRDAVVGAVRAFYGRA
jgi:UDP-2-acetamido-2-deoxy-ribo-hexuluronate aminotransferase